MSQMALFRDSSFVKIMAESIDIDEISDEACKIILLEVETKLRAIMQVVCLFSYP